MPNNFLVTGPPRSGKTTVIQNVLQRLRTDGLRVGGVYCPEIRVRDERVGFNIEDIMTGESTVLAHINRDWGPPVGKYRVAVQDVDDLCAQAFPRSLSEADVVIVDEIAPMEVHSDAFIRGVTRALDDEKPLVAAIHHRSRSGFIGEVKRREDIEVFTVTEETREKLPEKIASLVLECVE